jgi:hypothetical protein
MLGKQSQIRYSRTREDCLRLILFIAFSCLAVSEGVARNPSSISQADSILVPTDTTGLDLGRFALSIIKGARTDFERAEILLAWLSHNFKWLSTDYENRTVKEIIVRRGGNCFELAKVYMSLIRALGIEYRQVAEINIQPESDRREQSARDLVATKGLAYSVFGRQHNDHRWVEIYDAESKGWVPADPSVGVIGLEPWLKSRVWFGERWAIDTSVTNDMIIPFAVFVVDSSGRMAEARTEYYLGECFDRLYDGALSKLPSWDRWLRRLNAMSDKCKGAFAGKVNLHAYAQEIADIASVYASVKVEYQRTK